MSEPQYDAQDMAIADLAEQNHALKNQLQQRVVWIVAEHDGNGIVGVFASMEHAEAHIAAQLVEYNDMERSDYLIIRERVRGLAHPPPTPEDR